MSGSLLEDEVSLISHKQPLQFVSTRLILSPHSIQWSINNSGVCILASHQLFLIFFCVFGGFFKKKEKHTIPLALVFGVSFVPSDNKWGEATPPPSPSTPSSPQSPDSFSDNASDVSSISSSFKAFTSLRKSSSIKANDLSPTHYAVMMLIRSTNSSKHNAKSLQYAAKLHKASKNSVDSVSFVIHALDVNPDKKFCEEQPIYRPLVVTCNDSETAQKWIYQTLTELNAEVLPPKKIAVYINPAGGQGKATKIFDSLAKPMFELADIEIEVTLSKYREHVNSLVKKLDINSFDSLVAVSGDGLLHEIIDAIFSRDDWEAASKKISVGNIGAGTSNAMCKVLDCTFTELSTISIIKGSRTMYSHLSITWGLLADLDIESDAYRWMGKERFTVAGVVRLVNFRTYRGSIYAIPVGENDLLAASKGTSKSAKPKSEHLFEKAIVSGLPLTYNEPDLSSWPITFIDESIKHFCVSNVPWLSQEYLSAPLGRLNNGYLHVCVAGESLDRKNTLDLLVNQSTGSFLEWDSVISFRAKAICLFPEPRNPSVVKKHENGSEFNPVALKEQRSQGILNISGEEVWYAPIKVEIHPGVLNIISPIWLDEDDNSQPGGGKNTTSQALKLAESRVEVEWEKKKF
ncbi:hypothetical protein HK096_005382 [Nowakowskiella sp. JEL0078]|nr:hypothetical protein HK096_005382 [Nowakowskiella sp. JEL0078]